MPEVDLYNSKGETTGKINLPEEVFGVRFNRGLVHEAVVAYLANQRQGTACTKTRGEVSGGGIKPWRQKGTGRARAGSIRSPLWRHGGIVFGPKPRSWRMEFPKRKKRNAIRQILSEKIRENKLKIIESLVLEDAKTKNAKALLDKMGAGVGTLIITKASDESLARAFRNLPEVKLIPVGNINVYDLVKYENVLITGDAINPILEGLAR